MSKTPHAPLHKQTPYVVMLSAIVVSIACVQLMLWIELPPAKSEIAYAVGVFLCELIAYRSAILALILFDSLVLSTLVIPESAPLPLIVIFSFVLTVLAMVSNEKKNYLMTAVHCAVMVVVPILAASLTLGLTIASGLGISVIGGLLLGRMLARYQAEALRSRTIEANTRSQIARDLHDVTARGMTRIVLQLGALRNDLEGRSQEEIADEILHIEHDTRESLDRTHAVLQGIDLQLTAEKLGQNPFTSARHIVPANWGTARKLTLDARWFVDRPLTKGSYKTVLTLIGELLANAEKYAVENTVVKIHVLLSGTEICISQTNKCHPDDGGVMMGSSRGLSHLKHTMSKHGGTLDLSHSDSQWCADIRLPVTIA